MAVIGNDVTVILACEYYRAVLLPGGVRAGVFIPACVRVFTILSPVCSVTHTTNRS